MLHATRSILLALLALLVLLGGAARGDESIGDIDSFRKQVRPLIRSFIFSQYDKFAASELTFRDLKEHVSQALNVPYDALKADEASSVIEDENDKIANRCDGGKVSRDRCMTRFGMQPTKEEV